MQKKLENNLLGVCILFDEYAVQYIIVGGAAVALNGYYRHSINISGEITEKPDIDIWYNPTYENYYNILKVLEKLGVDVLDYKNEENPNPSKSFFKLEFEDFSLDLLPAIKADIKFREADKRKETVEKNGASIHFLNYVDLIEDKNASARAKDIEDIHQLKKIRGDK